MDERTISFWNECHMTKNISGLSATSYDTTIDLLKLREFIKPGIKVLEIGVGMGYVIKELYNKEISVSGLDVSEVALKDVKQYCEKTFTVDELDEIPNNYYDVIICLNVVQHVITSLLVEELYHLLRSLKEGGVFALEFISSEKTEDGGVNEVTNTGGSYHRSKKYLKQLIESLGGESTLVYDSIRFYDKDWLIDKPLETSGNWVVVPIPIDGNGVIGCHVFHVRKKKNI